MPGRVLNAGVHTAQKAYGCVSCKKSIAAGRRYVSVYRMRDDGRPGRDAHHIGCAPADAKAVMPAAARRECESGEF